MQQNEIPVHFNVVPIKSVKGKQRKEYMYFNMDMRMKFSVSPNTVVFSLFIDCVRRMSC